jgi:hypothetical protein
MFRWAAKESVKAMWVMCFMVQRLFRSWL